MQPDFGLNISSRAVGGHTDHATKRQPVGNA